MKRNMPCFPDSRGERGRAWRTGGICRFALLFWMALGLGACGTAPRQDPAGGKSPPGQFPRGGGYYLDDGPGSNPPPDLDAVADATPRIEPLHRGAMRPYTVMGREYVPMTALAPYRARGVASWYGRRYHGKRTSTGEPYDMYAMSAAHPTLPLPSYVRVTSVATGKSVVVRVNDRGPFIDSRLIDLSYTAAYKLGVIRGGSALVDVELVLPGESQPVMARAAPAPAAPATGKPAAAERAVTATAVAPQAAVPVSAAAPVSPPSAAAADHAAGIYLQLAAFGSRGNADAYASRVRADVSWLDGQLQVHPLEGLFRVRAGPYANREDAQQVAERINQTLRVKPVVQEKR